MICFWQDLHVNGKLPFDDVAALGAYSDSETLCTDLLRFVGLLVPTMQHLDRPQSDQQYFLLCRHSATVWRNSRGHVSVTMTIARSSAATFRN